MLMTTRTVSALSYMVSVLCFMALFPEAQAQNSDSAHWVGTWAAAPVGMDNSKGTIGSADFTIRQIVHTSLAGNIVRIIFTNEMGTTPLTLAGAQAASSAGGKDIVLDSARGAYLQWQTFRNNSCRRENIQR